KSAIRLPWRHRRHRRPADRGGYDQGCRNGRDFVMKPRERIGWALPAENGLSSGVKCGAGVASAGKLSATDPNAGAMTLPMYKRPAEVSISLLLRNRLFWVIYSSGRSGRVPPPM